MLLEIIVKFVFSLCIIVSLYLLDGRASLFFYVIVGLLFFCFMMKDRVIEIKKYFIENKIFCVAVTIVLSFLLIGNKMLVYPINETSIIKILQFGICTIMLIIPVTSILKTVNKVEAFRLERKIKTLSRAKYFIIILLCFILIESIYLVAFIPGVVSWDDYIVIAEAKGLYPIREYEGLFYIFMRYCLLNLFDNVTFITYVQIIFSGCIFSLIASWFVSLLDRRFHYRLLIIFSLMIIALPNNALMTITLTKDTFWAVSFIWLLYSITRITFGNTSKIILIQYVISLVLVWLVRQNGWIVVPLTIMSLLFFAIKRHRVSIMISSVIAIFFIFFAEVGLRSVEYEQIHPGLKYIAAFQDLLGVYYSDGDLDVDTKKMVESVIQDDFEDIYNPYWAEYVTWKESLGKINVIRFIKNYVITFFRNPLKLIKSVILRLDMLWDIQCGVNGIKTWQWWTEFGSEKWPDLIPERSVTCFTEVIDSFGKFTTHSGLKEFLWRCGISLFTCLLCFLVEIKNGRNVLKFVPFLALLIFYILSLGWEHYRYFWCIHLASFFYSSILFCETKDMINYDS